MTTKPTKTLVGNIDKDILAYTAGRDVELDVSLIEADCMGSAAHVVMLSQMPLKPALISKSQENKIIKALVSIMRQTRKGTFKIRLADQDVHLAVEQTLTQQLGDIGKKIHTGRSRNDQVALDLRLYAKDQLLATLEGVACCVDALLSFAKKQVAMPMVGRTHMQPAMPSSVGLWASSFAEGLFDDMALLINAYEFNDQSPLGSAAGYGVPLPIDRELVSHLLGFSRPCHNVLYASNSRGKIESIILSAMSQVMLTLSRWAQDMILYTMPEFNYFVLPKAFCTGSSMMPQKNNPDALELMRAKASKVQGHALSVYDLIKGLPSGYQRDLQEAKEPFLEGIHITRTSLSVCHKIVRGLTVNKKALLKGFTAEVFATDRAIECVAEGMPFRDAYDYVKTHIDELKDMDPYEAIAKKQHLGATAGLDFPTYKKRLKEAHAFVREERKAFNKAISKVLGVAYPDL
ncbi:MAG: argininosuccinate lyase [Kiritimatiellae bacterium]|nr:argininosuccinate lyase [Kiritimatiellia bacterium]